MRAFDLLVDGPDELSSGRATLPQREHRRVVADADVHPARDLREQSPEHLDALDFVHDVPSARA